MIGGGTQVIIHSNEAAVGDLHAGCWQPEVRGHRGTSGGDQQLIANDLRTVIQDHGDLAVSVTTYSGGPRI